MRTNLDHRTACVGSEAKISTAASVALARFGGSGRAFECVSCWGARLAAL